MKILQRYVFREMMLPFVLSVVVLNFIFMGGYMVKAANFIIGRGVPFFDTLYILMLALPGMVGYTVPTSILLSVLMVFGSLSQNNELRAMKASGINLLRVVTPAFFLGLFLSFAMFLFNDQVAGNAGFELRKELKKMVIKFPKALIEPGRFVRLSDSIIFMAKQMEGDELRDIIAYEVEESDKPVRTIIAERGEIVMRQKTNDVQIVLFNGSISDAEEEGVNTIQFKTYEFPSFGQDDIHKMQKKKKDLAIAEILMELEHPELSRDDRTDLWTALHERIAFAFGSFIFVLIGIPVAVLVRRGEIVLSFGIAMAAASFYYIFFAGVKTLAVQNILPVFVAMWIPNLLLIGLGIYLMRRSLAS